MKIIISEEIKKNIENEIIKSKYFLDNPKPKKTDYCEFWRGHGSTRWEISFKQSSNHGLLVGLYEKIPEKVANILGVCREVAIYGKNKIYTLEESQKINSQECEAVTKSKNEHLYNLLDYISAELGSFDSEILANSCDCWNDRVVISGENSNINIGKNCFNYFVCLIDCNLLDDECTEKFGKNNQKLWSDTRGFAFNIPQILSWLKENKKYL